MEAGIRIEEFQFRELQLNDGYVQVNVYVGNLPPTRVKARLLEYETTSKVCKLLTKLEIPFDVVAMRDYDSPQVMIEQKIGDD